MTFASNKRYLLIGILALLVVVAGVVFFVVRSGTRASASGPASASEIQGAAAPLSSGSEDSEFYSGETIAVKVPQNTIFKPGLRVNILECADPGGTVAHLPTSASTCDGNTIQGPTVLINRGGTVDYDGYTVYSLPNVQALGESPTGQPVCNASQPCVLYIGENQENFTAPHYFSQPFRVVATRNDLH